MTASATTHRNEIDGLRAVAVLPVILFHAGIPAFSGGYVGVDVFFVISGYLITNILLGDLENGSFSLVTFYERRARRIAPALFFMMAVITLVGWFVLLPPELMSFSHGLIAVVFFVSNILFWRESGYFDPAAEMNPLLHTWSLAVEEQFYLGFPILLLLMWRRCRQWIPAILTFAVIASLALAQWGAIYEPKANFFLLPTRAWELAIGSLCAIWLRGGVAAPDWARGALGFLGLALIAASVLLFDNKTAVPGIYGLVPTVGTALIILFATPDNFAGRILSVRQVVDIGLVSYSAYLWHQPLFALARQMQSSVHLGMLATVPLTALTFALAWLSWKYVERPFRQKGRFTRATIFKLTGLGSALLVATGVAGVVTQGGQFRFNERDQAFLAQADYRSSMQDFSLGTCFIDFEQGADDLARNGCFPANNGKPRLVIFGDSEAAHLRYGADRVFGQNYQVVQWTAASCRPFNFPDTTARCEEVVAAFREKILPHLTASDRLVLAGNWGSTEANIGEVAFTSTLRGGLRSYAASPARVVVFGDAPDFAFQPIQAIYRETGGDHSQPISAESIEFDEAEAMVEAEAGAAGVVHFDPREALCADECLIYDGDEPVFVDSNHLSKTGSLAVMEELRGSGVLE